MEGSRVWDPALWTSSSALKFQPFPEPAQPTQCLPSVWSHSERFSTYLPLLLSCLSAWPHLLSSSSWLLINFFLPQIESHPCPATPTSSSSPVHSHWFSVAQLQGHFPCSPPQFLNLRQALLSSLKALPVSDRRSLPHQADGFSDGFSQAQAQLLCSLVPSTQPNMLAKGVK